MFVRCERCGRLTGVAGDVGVKIKGMGIVDGACETSSWLLCRVLVRNVRVDRVDVHHVAGRPKTLSRVRQERRSPVTLIFPPLRHLVTGTWHSW